MKLAGKTDIGNQRTENQDNYRAGRQPDETVWALVCDGMGGARGGKIAAGIAAEHLEEVFSNELSTILNAKEMRPFITHAIEGANIAVYNKQKNDTALAGMGTTVVSVVVSAGYAHYAHVGDSRIYLFRNNDIEQLTKDHTMVQELVEQGTITENEATNHPHKNLITRALGVAEDVEIDYNKIKVYDDDIILLCSDGLSNCVPSKEIALILSTADFFDCADLLVKRALELGGQDNITAVLIQAEHAEDNNG